MCMEKILRSTFRRRNRRGHLHLCREDWTTKASYLCSKGVPPRPWRRPVQEHLFALGLRGTSVPVEKMI